MSTASHHHDHHSSPNLAVPSLRAGLIGVAANLMAIVAAWYTRRRGRGVAAELLEMNEAQLRDIGITHGDIYEALREHREDPTLRLNRISRSRRNHWISAS